MDIGELTIIYGNWCHRGVPIQRYRVHLSDALHANPLVKQREIAWALDRIIERLINGEAVTPFLSRSIRFGYVPPTSGKKKLSNRRDLDLLLNDWGIHHLHVSTDLDDDGFVKRSGPLLLAVFQRSDAYLIDLVQHGDWVREDIVRTFVRNWPDAGLMYRLNGVVGLRESMTPSDRKALREAGIAAPIDIDGVIYMPRTFLSSAGTSSEAFRSADRLLDDLEYFATKASTEPGWIAGLMRENGLHEPNAPDFRVMFTESGYVVVDLNSRLFVRLAPHEPLAVPQNTSADISLE